MPSPVNDAIDKLTAKVEALTTVETSATTLLSTLSGLLRDNANSPTAILALADKIDATTTDLAAAVVANTPAA